MSRRIHACSLVVALAACGGRASVGPRSLEAGSEPDARQRARDAELVARATPYVDAFTNSIPSLAPDGHVVFVSSRDGLAQLYVGTVAEPGRPPIRLPVPAERVVVPQLLPDGKTIVFLSDVGSDQKFHLFRIHVDGSGLADLTPTGELSRGVPQIARRAGTLVYGAHPHDEQATRVFAHTVDGAPREVYRDPKVGRIADVTGDGSRALYVQALSDIDEVVFSIELASGKATRLYPPVGEVAKVVDAAFTADATSVITAREVEGRPLRVLRIDAATGAEQAHADEATATTAALSQLAVSPRGDRVVVALDVGEHTELRMLDPRDLHALPAPAIPLGSIGLGTFSDDGTQLPLSIRLPEAPGDIATLDLASAKIVPLRNEPRPGLGTPPHASIAHVRAFDGLSIPVNVYLPDGAHGRLPTFVLVHGGPTSNAALAWSPTIGFWTAMGFAVIAPNIRGSTGYGIAYQQADDREHRIDALHDMESVNRWARAQPWCDGERIVIGGISYGGYMTLLALGHQPGLWRAGIDGSGMSNLKTMEQLEDQAVRSYDDTEFGVLGKDDALLEAWSPITAVDRITAPVFVYQGVRDPVTPRHEADQIVSALRRRHVPVEYMLIANEGHGVTRRENILAYLARSYRFLSEHMALP